MKIRKKVRSIAVIIFTVILSLNSVSAEASDLGKFINNDYEFELSDSRELSHESIEQNLGGSIGTNAVYLPEDSPGDHHSFKAGQVVIVKVSETDPNGNTTRRVYDKRGRLCYEVRVYCQSLCGIGGQ